MSKEETQLPEGHLMCEYGLRSPDAGSVGIVDPSVMMQDPVSSKWFSGQVIKQSFSTEDNILWGLHSTKGIRGTMSRWLSVIKDDSRTHLHVGTCTSHRLFDILPEI